MDNVVVEADGSRRLPFKAPAEFEPVIPSSSTLVISTIGADSLDQVISDCCHRPNLVADLAECMPYGMTSTSCNFSNQAAPSTFEEGDKNLLATIDGYVPSIVSGNPQPSRIQDSQSLTFIR